MRKREHTARILVKKFEIKGPRAKWEDNIKINRKGTFWYRWTELVWQRIGTGDGKQFVWVVSCFAEEIWGS
jgi:hypothetical protein